MALTSDQITAQNFADFYQTILPYLNGGGFGMKKLWENPAPTSAFAAQNVTLSSNDYDLLLVLDMLSSSFNGTGCNISPKGSGGKNDLATYANSQEISTQTWVRFYTYVDDTTVHFQDAVATWGSSLHTDNTKIIPYLIYGIKFYSYDNISCVMMSSTWEAGETTVEFTDPIIDGDSIFDVYLPSQYADLIYSSLSVSGHTLTITFPSAQASDIEVKLRVNRG